MKDKSAVARRLQTKRTRFCLSLHECCLCGAAIYLGQLYHDGGYGNRAHLDCVDKFIAKDKP